MNHKMNNQPINKPNGFKSERKQSQISKEGWIFKYFHQLRELYDIFISGVKKTSPWLYSDLTTPDFFDHFVTFIWDTSSRALVPVPDLTDHECDQYDIYKNDISTKY